MAESIYTWIAPAPVAPEKPPLYHARAPANAPLAGSTLRVGAHTKGWGTMGAELKGTVRPDQFLKSHERTGVVDTKTLPKPYHRPAEETRKAGVPSRAELAASAKAAGAGGGAKSKDFVTENAISAILASPRSKPKPAAPDWKARPGYGQRPAYLDRVAGELAAEKAYVLDLLDAQQQQHAAAAGGGRMRELGDGERAELLAALKKKWSEVNAKYGLLSHRKISTSNSTQGEIRFKCNLEDLMSQLEADIKKLSVNAPIFVAED